MDNFAFDITTNQGLEDCLRIAFSQHRDAPWWRTDERDDRPRFVLSWIRGDDRDMAKDGWHPFPVPIDAQSAVAVVKDWLDRQSYGREPDHDGDNGKGWRIYNEGWGHVAPYHYKAFVAVEPAWAMYGK